MECITCLERHGKRVDGGELGRCRRCEKRKCRLFTICGHLSGGKELCVYCEMAQLEADLRSRATNPTEYDPRIAALDLRARKELAWEASRFLIEAVLCVRRAMLLHLDAFHGDIRRPPIERDDAGDLPKAA